MSPADFPNPHLAKIVTLEAFLPERERLRREGKTLVMTNGCFDILHVGHARSLVHAKSLGDLLLVAINSDRAVRALKGPARPVANERERAELLACLAPVDRVLVFDGDDARDLILAVRPDIHAKGTDYTEETVPERAEVRSYGGRVAIVGDPKDHSTKEMIRRIREGYAG